MASGLILGVEDAGFCLVFNVFDDIICDPIEEYFGGKYKGSISRILRRMVFGILEGFLVSHLFGNSEVASREERKN